jgi:hypothetical protein
MSGVAQGANAAGADSDQSDSTVAVQIATDSSRERHGSRRGRGIPYRILGDAYRGCPAGYWDSASRTLKEE